MALIPRVPGPAWNKPFFNAEYEEGMESTLRRIVETQHRMGFTERSTCGGGRPQKLGSHTWIVKKSWTRKGKQHVALWGWCQSREAPWESSQGEGAGVGGLGGYGGPGMHALFSRPHSGRSSRTIKNAKVVHMRAWRQAWRREVALAVHMRAWQQAWRREVARRADAVQGFTHWHGSKAWGWGCFPRRRTMKLAGCSLIPG